MLPSLVRAVVMVAVFLAVWMGLDYLFTVVINHQQFAPNWGFALAASLVFGGIVLVQSNKRRF